MIIARLLGHNSLKRGDFLKQKITRSLEENISEIKRIFGPDQTLICHRFQPVAIKGLRCCLFSIDGLVSSAQITESILRPISTLAVPPAEGVAPIDFLQQQVLQAEKQLQRRTSLM